jgi:hypothetical protein
MWLFSASVLGTGIWISGFRALISAATDMSSKESKKEVEDKQIKDNDRF